MAIKEADIALSYDDRLARIETFQTKPTKVESEAEPSTPGPLTNAQFHLTLEVPGKLVLRGTDIKSGNGPSLGDMNVTVGGTLEFHHSETEASSARLPNRSAARSTCLSLKSKLLQRRSAPRC